MAPATQPRSAVAFLIILVLGMSLGLPTEDVLDAIYDESGALPYEVIPLFSSAAQQLPSRTTQPPLSFFHPTPRAPSPFALAHTRNTDVPRCTDARDLSAQLCILLC